MVATHAIVTIERLKSSCLSQKSSRSVSKRRSVGVEGAPGKEDGDERSWQWPREQYTWRLLSCRT